MTEDEAWDEMEAKQKKAKAFAHVEQEHKLWCDYLNIMLTSLPPQKAKCNCKQSQPIKPWVSLTSEELALIVVEHAGFPTRQLAAIEAALKEKNNG